MSFMVFVGKPMCPIIGSNTGQSGVGLIWATAKKTIQTAVDFVDVNGTVFITNGTSEHLTRT